MLGNTLKAPELLRNKGIRFETWKKWDKTMETLPSTGLKQYEPNCSWLQNKQIEKGLNDRKDLLSIERVERSSQLAAAEWLPQQSRARVTKKSGQEWTSFGLEENLELYLIPEEALLLLELNCLELTWEGVALSIQQAYSILLGSDRSQCSIDEYRVYSHLVRQGYRLQRFRYEDATVPRDRCIRLRRSSTLKRKKLIHDPLDGFGLTRDLIQADAGGKPETCSSTATIGVSNDPQPSQETASDPNFDHRTYGKTSEKLNECQMSSQSGVAMVNESKMTVPTGVGASRSGNSMENAVGDCILAGDHSLNIGNEDKIAMCESGVKFGQLTESKRHLSDNLGGVKRLPSELYDNGVVNLPGPSNIEANKVVKKSKDSKLQIISDETLVGDFKIISKWPGTRIQRNVKWMPKRKIEETFHPIVENINDDSSGIENIDDKSASPLGHERWRITGMPNSSRLPMDVDNSKGQRRVRTQEVIEVSDDEIEELPQKMSRTEMLNRFPNVISEPFHAKQIPRRYLPPNVCPKKISNQYIKWTVLNEDKRENSDVYEISRVGTSVTGQISYGNTASCYGSTPVTNLNGLSINYRNEILRQGSRIYEALFESTSTHQGFCDQAAPWAAQINKGALREQGHVAAQLGIYTNVAVAQSIWAKSQFPRRGLLHRQNLWTNMSYYHSRQNLVNSMPRLALDRASHRNSVSEFPNTVPQGLWNDPRRMRDTLRYPYSNSRTKIGESSFRIVPGASSWAETKAKWLDEKTITIEDEDCTNDEDGMVDESEVKVVARPVEPLVGRRNASNFSQIYKSLQIIKPATSRDFRRSKKAKQTVCHRIAYNLYPTAQQFRKANPGIPTYRIVVLRSEDTSFIELADIVRLQTDSKETPVVLACASQTSVTFAELGTVRIPELRDNYNDQ